MYCPSAFEESDAVQLTQFVRRHPLATLVRMEAGALCADHIPLLPLEHAGGRLALQGHVARANPLWRSLTCGTPVLAIFQDPGCYITPSWYAGKKQHGKVVPTWNYVAVHARGPMQAFDDPQWLRAFLERLTDAQEARRPHPWRVTDAPEDYVGRQLRAIVGVEMQVEHMVGKWKVSQNKPPEDIDSVVEALRAEDDPQAAQMADWVEQRRPR